MRILSGLQRRRSDSPTDNKRNELTDTDDNDLRGRGKFFHRTHFLHRRAARPSKISEREGDMAPRRELHKRAAREEEKRRMAADVRVLAREGIEI